jgi:tight adherence protein B
MIPFAVFMSCLGVTVASYWLMTRKATAQRQLLGARMTEVLGSRALIEAPKVRLKRNVALSDMPGFNRLLLRLGFLNKLRFWVEQAGVRVTVMRLAMFSVIAGMLTGLLLSFFITSLVVKMLAGLVAAAIPFMYVWHKRKKRLHAFLSTLPDALDLMSRGLLAGHAFTESLHIVATEMTEPIAGEFGKTYEEQKLGLSYKLALKNLTERIPLLELRLCVTAILIQRETGGNLAEILEKVGTTIRERFKIIEDLKTLTTSSRLSAWVLCALPMVIAGVVSLLNPDYMSVLWRDSRGQKLVYIALGMQLTGMLIVRKIMRIKI